MWVKITVIVYCVGNIGALIFPWRNNYRERVNYVFPENEVAFYLYHSSNLSEFDQLFVDNPDSILNSRFDGNLSTKLIVHGWTHGKDVPWLIEMREALATLNQWNVIIADWSLLSHAMYTEARVHTSAVGRKLTKFCEFLSNVTGIKMPSIHMIGHSMGAQIAAFAGHQILQDTDQPLGRITGLDPAAPLYEWPHVESLDEIIDPSDALFVDIIHTNGKHLGIIFPSGHVDFYPNGGQVQPGCTMWACSHLRSCEFFTASIKKPDLFKAYSFEFWDEFIAGKTEGLQAVPMGIAANASIPYGSYFLETTDEEKAFVNTTTTILDSIASTKAFKRARKRPGLGAMENNLLTI